MNLNERKNEQVINEKTDSANGVCILVYLSEGHTFVSECPLIITLDK